MSSFLTILFIAALYPSMGTSISGVVVGPDKKPIPHATVFLEESITTGLRKTQADAKGFFSFNNIPQGRPGIFAIADSCSWGGVTIPIIPGEAKQITIQLKHPGTLTGKVLNSQGKAVASARITRVAVLGTSKVGIPLAKLEAEGYPLPVTDKNGIFHLENFPKGEHIALKIVHPSYAQETMADIVVGGHTVRVTLSPGVIISGQVLEKKSGMGVPNAGVLFRTSAYPGTTVVVTNQSGEFMTRLKPGEYVSEVIGSQVRSAGLAKLVVTGQEPEQHITLHVSGIVLVTGDVRDAISQKPVSGAKVLLNLQGNPADIKHTGNDGTFHFQGTPGPGSIELVDAPGYITSGNTLITFNLEEGKDMTLPTFWVLPLPHFELTVLGKEESPVPNAIICMHSPPQEGWWTTNQNGQASLHFHSLTGNKQVIGTAYHPQQPLLGTFALQAGHPKGNRVQLLPASLVTGRVISDKGTPLSGIIITCILANEPDGSPVPLWKTVSRKDGSFSWPLTVPGVSLCCIVMDSKGHHAQSKPFHTQPGKTNDIGTITLPDGVPGTSLWNRKIRLTRFTFHSRKTLNSMKGQYVLIRFCPASSAQEIIEATSHAQELAGQPSLSFVVIVDGPVPATQNKLPVGRGNNPGTAQTYLVSPEGTVLLETWGLPPLSLVYPFLQPPGTQEK